MANLFAALPNSRGARVSDLTKGFMAEYRRARIAEGAAPGTVNRDLTAMQAFQTWCVEDQGLAVARPQVRREWEPAGRERWLSAEEFAELERVCPLEWWPLVATLAYTGVRVGEAQGLVGEDVHLAERRISINEANRHVKTPSSVRDVPIPEPLAGILAEHLVRFPGGPSDPVFPHPLHDYRALRVSGVGYAMRGYTVQSSTTAGTRLGSIPLRRVSRLHDSRSSSVMPHQPWPFVT